MTTRIIEASPTLSLLSSAYNATVLQWSDISVPGVARLNYYYVFRGNGSNPASFAIVGTTSSLTFNDTNVASGVTYTYFVIGQYDYGAQTPQSNRITVTVPFAIEYIYGYKSNGDIAVLSVIDVNNPSIAATVNLGLDATGSQVMAQDDKYIYLMAGTQFSINKLYVIDWATNKLSPSLKKTLTSMSGFADGALVVRRGVASRNNLMFTSNNNDQMTSWNISDPENPTLIQSVNAPVGVYNGYGAAYSPSDNRLYFGVHGGITGYAYLPVNADGTFGTGAGVVIHPSLDRLLNGTALADGHFWAQYPADSLSLHYGYVLDSASVDAGISAGVGSDYSGWFPGRFRADGLHVLRRSTAHASLQAVVGYTTIPTVSGTIRFQLGGTNNICGGLVSFGNLIYFFVNNFLYIYDISNVDSPSLVSSLNLGATYINFSSFPDSLGYANNGLCVA